MPPLPLEMTAGALADFSRDGPIKGTIQQLPDRARVTDVTVDEQGNIYGITNHEIVRIDPKTLAVSVLKVAGDVPQLSWTCGVAFDTKRKRLVVATLGGAGDLVAFDSAKEQWSYINGLNNIDLGALTYSHQEDCYFGIGMSMGADRAKSMLFTFAPDGTRTGAVAIDEILVTTPRPDGGAQMAMMGRNVAIITSPGRGAGARGVPAEPGRCILVDPKTGRVISSQSITERPAPATDFNADETDRLWRQLGSANAEDAEQATLRLIGGGSKAVDALSPRTALAQPIDAKRVSELVQLAGNADAKIRERATNDLLQAGPSIVPQLREAAKSDLPVEAAMRVAMALDELTHTQRGEIPKAQAERERRLIRVLQEIATSNAIEALIKLSANDSPGSTTSSDARAALRKI
jgi:hypothetical protein